MRGAIKRQLLSGRRFDYHFDSNRGNDSYHGRSRCQPFRTPAKLPTPLNNARVGLAAGSNWRALFNAMGAGTSLSSANVSFKGYGNGPQAVIDASDIIDTAEWSAVGGLTATYQTSANMRFPAADLFSVPVVIVYEDGVPLAYKTSQANVDATAGGAYTVNSHSGTTGRISIRATDGSNPASNGKVYEYTARAAGLNINSAGGVVVGPGIHLKRSGTTLGSLQILGDGTLPLVEGCTFTDSARHAVGMPAGTIRNCVFNEAYDPSFDGTLSMLVFFEGTGSGKPSYSINNTFNFGSRMNAVTYASMNVPTAATAHTGAGGTLGTVNYLNNNISGLNGYAIAGLGAGVGGATVNIIGGTWLEVVAPVGAPSTGRVTNVSGVRMKCSALSSTYFANMNGGGTLNVANVNICLANINQGMFRKTDATATTLNITGSTFYAQATQFIFNQIIVDFGTNLTVSLNSSTLDVTNGSEHFGLGATDVYTGDNNAFVGTQKWVLNGVTYTTLATYKAAASPNDANSVNTGSGASACTL